MKKIISSLLVIVLLLSSLVSCGDRKYDENEVKEAAKRLIAESIVLNDIFWGNGLPYSVNRDTADGDFYEADYVYYKRLGFETVDELMALAAKTFSEDQCKMIKATVISRVDDPDLPLSRYYQKVSLDTGEPESIMVNSKWNELIIGTATYDYNSVEVIESEKKIVYVTVNATVTYENNEPQQRTLKIGLIEEDDGWKLDSHTYLSYDITNIK